MSPKTPKKTPLAQAQLVDARRSQILDAATAVFAEKGFHGATIRQIARQAGIADGTIYIYFKNKTELLLGILHRLNESEQRPADLARTPQDDFRGFVAGYIRHRMNVLAENLQAFRAILPDVLASADLRRQYLAEVVEPTFDLAEPVFKQWIAAGALKPVDVALALRAVSGLVLGVLVLRLLGDATVEQQWDQLPELLADMILNGWQKEQRA
jgi:AcrR family transcriptional regulator